MCDHCGEGIVPTGDNHCGTLSEITLVEVSSVWTAFALLKRSLDPACLIPQQRGGQCLHFFHHKSLK